MILKQAARGGGWIAYRRSDLDDPSIAADRAAHGWPQRALGPSEPGAAAPPRVRLLRVGCVVWGVLCALGALSVRAASLHVAPCTLGAPAGAPEGNPFVAGSAPTSLQALRAALTRTLGPHTVFTPANMAVWGPGGQFGRELYFLSLVAGLPRGAVLEEGGGVLNVEIRHSCSSQAPVLA